MLKSGKFRLPGKKQLYQNAYTWNVLAIDVTQSREGNLCKSGLWPCFKDPSCKEFGDKKMGGGHDNTDNSTLPTARQKDLPPFFLALPPVAKDTDDEMRDCGRKCWGKEDSFPRTVGGIIPPATRACCPDLQRFIGSPTLRPKKNSEITIVALKLRHTRSCAGSG